MKKFNKRLLFIFAVLAFILLSFWYFDVKINNINKINGDIDTLKTALSKVNAKLNDSQLQFKNFGIGKECREYKKIEIEFFNESPCHFCNRHCYGLVEETEEKVSTWNLENVTHKSEDKYWGCRSICEGPIKETDCIKFYRTLLVNESYTKRFNVTLCVDIRLVPIT